MTIQDAIALTRQDPRQGIFIRRKGWPYNMAELDGYKIRPTNAPCGCVSYSYDLPPEKWVPNAADLVADDWVTCL